MSESIKNIIFDLGGVLLRWNPDEVARLAFPDEAKRERVLKSIFSTDVWHRYDAGEFDGEDAIEVLSANASVSRDDMLRFMNTVREYLIPIPESLALMKELRAAGKRLYCLSNVNKEFYSYFKNKYQFLSEFDGTVISGELGICKPDPRIFEHLMKEYNLKADESIFIDDSQPNVDAACRLGIKAIRFVSAEESPLKIKALAVRKNDL